MSEKCHYRKSVALFNYLVSAVEQRQQERDAERLGVLDPVQQASNMRAGRRTSCFRYPGLVHAFNEPLALRQKGRIFARCTGVESANGESRSEGKSRPNHGPRFIEPIEMPQRGSEPEIRDGVISVHLDGPTVPRDSLLIAAEKKLGEARDPQPEI